MVNDLQPDPGAGWRFFSRGVRAWDQTASLFPSSRFLIRALTRSPELARARLVVELGPGTGGVTRGILAAMPADAVLVAIEIDEALVTAAAREIRDPRVRWVHGSATDIPAELATLGLDGPVDVVVSSLGMSLLPADIRDGVMDAVLQVLPPGGVFVQFGYWHARWVVWSAQRGFSRFPLRPYLAKRFRTLDRELVVANIPPAAVFTCKR